MRITSRGQVTIPQKIREKAGLLPNTEVEFEYVRGKVVESCGKAWHERTAPGAGAARQRRTGQTSYVHR